MRVKKALKSLLGGQSKNTSYKVYQSIDDLPIYNWFKIFETKKLDFLTIKGNPKEDVLNETWANIFDEYIRMFGLNDSFKAHFEKTKQILDLRVKIALSNSEKKKKQLLFKLKVKLDKFESINPTEEDNNNFMDVVVAIEKALNRTINEHEITVNKFYTYLKQLESE